VGKGFAMEDNLDLGKELLKGYEHSRDPCLPHIKITAIANDAVSTLVSFAYQFRSNPRRKAAMGLIVGTGCNATIPLALSQLHSSKRPKQVKVLDNVEPDPDLKVTVNTEWTIKGAARPLYELDFMTHWDQKLDKEGDRPGFQPFEYMTAGRYLGELGRIIIVDYFTNQLRIPEPTLPPKLRERHGLTTSFLGNLGPHLAPKKPSMLKQLEAELPPSEETDAWQWTPEAASIIFEIAKAVQIRAAGMTAAAIVGLLACAGEIHFSPSHTNQDLPNGHAGYPKSSIEELLIGYTGGCIVHFQDYLQDCQSFLDSIMSSEFGNRERPRVLLTPCHDGGIMGAGILAGTVQSIARDV
jgi:hexokinase